MTIEQITLRWATMAVLAFFVAGLAIGYAVIPRSRLIVVPITYDTPADGRGRVL